MTTVPPNQPIIFTMPGDSLFRPQWEVMMNENGSLSIYPYGRRNGKVLVAPQSQNSIIVTTDKIEKS